MPGDELKLQLRLTADNKGFVGEVRVAKRELDKFTGSTDKGGRANTEYARTARRGAAANRSLGKSFLEAHGHSLKYIIGIGSIPLATRSLLRHADSYTQISNAVRIATGSAAEHAQVSEKLFGIAQRTRAPLTAVADLYQKLSISAADLGASNSDMLQVIEGVGQALVINGTSAAQASGALLQLSQALGGGVVRAEEFNSVLEGAKPILIAAANNLDAAGGSVSKLRKLVAAGEITSREFFEALRRGLPELAADFERTNSTIGQGFVQVDNAMTRFVGGVDEARGVSAAFAGALEGIAEAIAEVEVDALADGLDRTVTLIQWLAAALAGRAALALTVYGLQMGFLRVQKQYFALAATNAAAKTDVARLRMLAGANAARRYGLAVNSASKAIRFLSRGLSLAAGPAGWLVLAASAFFSVMWRAV